MELMELMELDALIEEAVWLTIEEVQAYIYTVKLLCHTNLYVGRARSCRNLLYVPLGEVGDDKESILQLICRERERRITYSSNGLRTNYKLL